MSEKTPAGGSQDKFEAVEPRTYEGFKATIAQFSGAPTMEDEERDRTSKWPRTHTKSYEYKEGTIQAKTERWLTSAAIVEKFILRETQPLGADNSVKTYTWESGQLRYALTTEPRVTKPIDKQTQDELAQTIIEGRRREKEGRQRAAAAGVDQISNQEILDMLTKLHEARAISDKDIEPPTIDQQEK